MDKSFKQAVVIFIDVLGTQDRKEFADWYRVMEVFSDSIRKEKEYDLAHPWTIYKREIHLFSDCAYIIYDFKDDVEEVKRDIYALMCIACYNSEKLIYDFLKNEFIVRGAITCGDIYYDNDKNIWFGPAMNRAYKLESKSAKNPRIIIDPANAEKLMAYNNKTYRDTEEKCLYNGEIIKRDKDGIYYLNYFNSIAYMPGADMVLKGLYYLCIKEKAKFWTDIEKSMSICEKYDWLEERIAELIDND